MSQHKHIHPAPVSAGRQIATALALAGLASFSLPAIAADYVGINDLGASRDNQDGSGASGSFRGRQSGFCCERCPTCSR